MSLVTAYDGGTASAMGEQNLALLPKGYPRDGSMRGVIFLHAFNTTELEVLDPVNQPQFSTIAATIAQAGYPCVSTRVTGNGFGNDATLAKVGLAKTYLQGTLGAKSGTVFLVGESMGGGTAYAWARANLAATAGVVGLIPLSDMADIVNNNRDGAAASVNAAYGSRTDSCTVSAISPTVLDASIVTADAGKSVTGTGAPTNAIVGNVSSGASFQFLVGGVATNGTASGSESLTVGGYSDAVYGAAHNPVTFASQLSGLPIQIWYAADDTVVIPSTVTTFITNVGGSAVDAHNMGNSGGHSDASLASVTVAMLLAFLAAHA